MDWRNMLAIAGIAERRGFKLHLRRSSKSRAVEQQVAFEQQVAVAQQLHLLELFGC
jgi:hypothetical protein